MVENDTFNRALGHALVEALLPASVAMGEYWPALYPDSEAWASKLDVIVPGRTIHTAYRRTFHFHPARFAPHRGWRDRVSSEFRVLLIAELLAGELGDELTAEILVTWKDLQTFSDEGFGFALLRSDTIASLC